MYFKILKKNLKSITNVLRDVRVLSSAMGLIS